MRILFFLIAVSFFISTSIAQQFTNWQNYTALKNVSDNTIINNSFWSASAGGAFQFINQTGQFNTLHKSDGLEGNSLTSVTTDKFGRIWFGSIEGIIDIYDTENYSFDVILDIYNSNQINKNINDLTSSGDTMIVSSDFGVSLVNINNFLFYDTFFKFGSFPSNTKVNSTFKTDLFYVCTDAGIAIQKQGAVNLSAPESWNVYSIAEGLPSDKTLKAGIYQNSVIVGTDNGFSQFVNNTWNNFITELTNSSIDDFRVKGDSILVLSENNIYVYHNNVLNLIYSSVITLTKIEFQENYGIVCASSNGSLYLNIQLDGEFLSPNAPPVNQFPNTTVDVNGKFWSASGNDATGVGYYTYNGEIWNHFDVANTPELPTNGIYQVYAWGTTSYLGTWGRGFVEIAENGSVTIYNTQNTGMQGININPEFLVITGFGKDSQSNLWVLNLGAVNNRNISVRTSGGEWYHFLIPAENNFYLQSHYHLAVDPYDTKWYGVNQPSRQGLFYFNENKTFTDSSDDKSDYITTADGLNTNEIRDIAVDKRGDVWVATGLGVNIITNTSGIPSSGSAGLRISSVFTLRQQSVNAIAVDPINQKWIGTNEGLLLVNSDGSRLLASFTTQNSALLSNQIRSLTIDENNGIVYVGTDQGLTSFYTPYVKPAETSDGLFVYPNPYFLNSNNTLLTIDGLVADTDIKILSISGELVAEFTSPGGRIAFWDGKDDNGNFVGSGVYIIVAYDAEGNNVIKGKVAVLRD
jgi:ligand-binding sensor domain-containing protein